MKWENESKLALSAVSSASDILTRRPQLFNVSSKESLRDLVTDFDVEIEEHVKSLLATSGYPAFGEESMGDQAVPAGQVFWMIDPIDGTTNFVADLHYYAISVCLCLEEEIGHPQFLTGAVSIPETKELFFTHGDQGAFNNGKRLVANDRSLSTSLVSACFSSGAGGIRSRDEQYIFFGKINDRSRGCLRTGSSAVNICYTAASKINVTYGLGIQYWDIAGALAIAELAGCEVICQRIGNSTRTNFIVGAESAFNEVRELMEREGLCRF